MSLKSHSQILNGDIDFLLFHIIKNKMKQQITENDKKNNFLKKKYPGFSSVLNLYIFNGQISSSANKNWCKTLFIQKMKTIS